MTTATPSRGRRRAPTRIERAVGRAAALQRPRVILALLLLLALTCTLLLDGYLRAEVGGDERVRTGASSSEVPDKILNGGPILTFQGGQATTVSVPDKTIALTFDDGPDPGGAAADRAGRHGRAVAGRDGIRRLVRLRPPGRRRDVRPRRDPARAGVLLGGVRRAADVREDLLPDGLLLARPLPRLDRVVSVFNARAVTIYLWHGIALVLAVPLIDRMWDVPAFETYLPLGSQWFLFGVGWVLIGVFVLLCGWVGDVAGRKKPRLLP